MRFTGFLMIAISGLVFGLDKYYKYVLRLKRFDLYLSLLNEIEFSVSTRMDDVNGILEYSDNEIAALVVKSDHFTTDIFKAWDEAAGYIFCIKEDKDLVALFIREFGRSDLESSLKVTRNHIEAVKRRSEILKADFRTKGKIYVIFSFFISFTLGLLLV